MFGIVPELAKLSMNEAISQTQHVFSGHKDRVIIKITTIKGPPGKAGKLHNAVIIELTENNPRIAEQKFRVT
jgi:hypothetical protein